MTTITREQQKQILIDTANHVISRDNTSPYSENLRELARIALSALKNAPLALSDNQGRPRALVVPPAIEPDYKVIKSILPTANPDEYACCIAADMWNACRAALLHGAEPVSQTYELPQTQFEQVADLYEMQFDDGRTCAFHTDGAKAAPWLLACDGNKVQEYVRLERYHEALIGNSPVIPDGYALVPIVPTEDMVINGFESEPDPHFSDEKVWAEYEALSGCRRAARRAELCWAAMIKAAPKQEGNNG